MESITIGAWQKGQRKQDMSVKLDIVTVHRKQRERIRSEAVKPHSFFLVMCFIQQGSTSMAFYTTYKEYNKLEAK